MSNQTMPIIHLNGTSAKVLARGYCQAHKYIKTAIRVVEEIEFNSRDYYLVPGLWEKAVVERKEAVQKLCDAAEHFRAIGEHCYNLELRRGESVTGRIKP